MAQNEPQRKETPPGPSPNSPSVLFEYQCRSGKFIKLANLIEKNWFGSENRIETFLAELECSTALRCSMVCCGPCWYRQTDVQQMHRAAILCQQCQYKSPNSITERRVPELIPVLGSQPASDVNHKAGGRLPLLSARPAVTPTALKSAATSFAAWWTEAQWVWTVCLRRLRFEPRPFCAWVQHANQSVPSHPSV